LKAFATGEGETVATLDMVEVYLVDDGELMKRRKVRRFMRESISLRKDSPMMSV
jgi:hypothetical protein